MSDFLDALDQVTDKDLADIDREIDELGKQIAKLKVAKNIVSKLVGLSPKRTLRQTGNGPTVRQQVVKYLASAGKASVPAIAGGIGQEPKNLYTPLNHEWFTKLDGSMWTLTPEGKVEAKSLENS